MIKKVGLVVDVETTGLSPKTDEMVEIAVKLFTFDQDGQVLDIIDEDAYLREPLSASARRNYEQAYRVHGIPFEEVEGKSFYDVKLKTYFHRADVIFAHNASFDRSFIYQMYPEVNDLSWHCTMRGVPWKEYGFSNSKLLTLLQAHYITDYQSHRAMDDITNLLELMKQQAPNGKTYLQQVLTKGPMRKYQPVLKEKNKSFI